VINGSILWKPQKGPQTSLVRCPIKDILFGGARGGGKTDGTLGRYSLRQKWLGAKFNEVYFRQEMPQADDLIERAKELYLPLGAHWQDQKKQFTFEGGGRLRFRPLGSVQDATKYAGQNLSGCTVEESGNYPSPEPIDRMWGAMRGGDWIQMVQTANPGGAGQSWLSERYVEEYPEGNQIINCKLPNGTVHQRVFIPSKVRDNKILLENDPDYVNRLYLVGSKELVKAWLDGDWSAIEGAFFDNWHRGLILRPFKIPEEWLKFRSMDWGYAAPFSVGWWAICIDPYEAETINDDKVIIPRGAMVRYREWYGKVSANKGLRLDAEEVAAGIKELEAGETIKYGVLDPAAFAVTSGPSIGETLWKAGAKFRRADNRRVSVRGSISGWDQVRSRITGIDGSSMIYFFSTCKDTIRTLPTLPHDPNRLEDLDTRAEDHAADEIRYACMSRPMTPDMAVEPEPDFAEPKITFEDLRLGRKDRSGRRLHS